MTDHAPPGPEAPVARRRSLRPVLLGVVPALAGAIGLYWYATSGRYVSTENAYVKSDIVAISPEVEGHVISVEVAENQLVKQGDVLFRIDPESFRIALDLAEAKVMAVRHEVEASRAEFHQIEAEIDEAKARVDFAEQQAKRQRELQGRGIAAQASLDEAEMSSCDHQAAGHRSRREAAHRARQARRRPGERGRAAPGLSGRRG